MISSSLYKVHNSLSLLRKNQSQRSALQLGTVDLRCVPVALFALFLSTTSGVAGDWATSYASLARTSYLPGDGLTPPFALAWEATVPQPLAGAPVVAINRAFLTDKQLDVWALDLNDGHVVWSHDDPRSPSDVRCYEAMTGIVRWTQKVDGNLIHTPQISQVAVYVSTSTGKVYAFNQNDGHLLWQVSLASPLTLPAADAQLVVVGAGSSVVALNAANGTVVFTQDVGTPASTVPILTPEGVYVHQSDRVLALDRAGHERWHAPLSKPAWAALAVTKAGVLAGSVDGSVQLLSRDDGHRIWETVLAGVPNCVSGAGDVVYVGTRQGTLVGLQLASGTKLWSASLAKGQVDGVALSGGRLVVTSGTWVGALLPAPDAPTAMTLHQNGANGHLAWAVPTANGSAISAYRIFRRRGTDFVAVGTVTANGFTDRLLPGGVGYEVTAIAANGAESARSTEVTTANGEPLVQRLAVAPLPMDTRRDTLTASFTLREDASVTWRVVDAEGAAITDDQTVLLGKGPATLQWSGQARNGGMAEPGVYRVSLTATAGTERDQEARAFPVNWALNGGAGSPLAGTNGPSLHGASAGGGAGTSGSGAGVATAGSPSGSTGGPSTGSGSVANATGTGAGATGTEGTGTGAGSTSGPATGAGSGPHDNGWHNGANPNEFTIHHDDKSQGGGNNHHAN